VFENRVLRRLRGPLSKETMASWRRLVKDGLHNLYILPVIRAIKARRMRQTGHGAYMGEIRNAHKILAIDGRIILDIREIGWEVVKWVHLAQDRDQWILVNMVMNPQFP
jgi:hypothetical protein